jgi:hypothetical protein
MRVPFKVRQAIEGLEAGTWLFQQRENGRFDNSTRPNRATRPTWHSHASEPLIGNQPDVRIDSPGKF